MRALCVIVGDSSANKPGEVCNQNKAAGCAGIKVIPADSIEALP
ncbi:MAG: hypothetical protein PHC61_13635 [Chitinivibrionales bacterium]|nr:hypothetical protein [Chitinivibrionales bacterium]